MNSTEKQATPLRKVIDNLDQGGYRYTRIICLTLAFAMMLLYSMNMIHGEHLQQAALACIVILTLSAAANHEAPTLKSSTLKDNNHE